MAVNSTALSLLSPTCLPAWLSLRRKDMRVIIQDSCDAKVFFLKHSFSQSSFRGNLFLFHSYSLGSSRGTAEVEDLAQKHHSEVHELLHLSHPHF